MPASYGHVNGDDQLLYTYLPTGQTRQRNLISIFGCVGMLMCPPELEIIACGTLKL